MLPLLHETLTRTLARERLRGLDAEPRLSPRARNLALALALLAVTQVLAAAVLLVAVRPLLHTVPAPARPAADGGAVTLVAAADRRATPSARPGARPTLASPPYVPSGTVGAWPTTSHPATACSTRRSPTSASTASVTSASARSRPRSARATAC